MTSPIQDQINLLKEQLADHEQQIPRNGDKINAITNRISELEYELAQTTAEKEVRVQQQEEKIQSITLPHDFSEIFGDPRANDIIIEVIQQDRRQENEEHNGEIEKLHQLYREQLRAVNQREIELQQQLEELHSRNKETHQHLHEALDRNAELEIEKMDAEQKRDNAVKQLEDAQAENARLNSQVDDLRKEAAVGARNAYKVIDGSDRLNELVNQSKQAKIKSAAELALESATPFRGTVKLPEVKVTEPVNSFRTDPTAEPQGNQLPASEAVETVGGNLGGTFPVTPPGIPSIPSMAKDTSELGGSGAEAQVTRQEFEKRVGQLESYVEAVVAKLGLTPDPNNGEGQVA